MLKFILKASLTAAFIAGVVIAQSFAVLYAYDRGRVKVFLDCAKTGVVLEGDIVMVCAVTTLDKLHTPDTST